MIRKSIGILGGGISGIALAAHLGDKDGALKLLQRNFAEARGHQIRLAETDPDFDGIRDDPRFQKMLAAAKKRLGIADPPPSAASAKTAAAASD